MFSRCCGSGESKSRLAKAAGVEPSGQMKNDKLHTVVVRSISKSRRAKHLSFGALLGIEMSKCTHAAVAPSTFQSHNPPTPAFIKAGAAPGTTAGVEPVFVDLPPSTRHSGHCPLLLRAFKPAVCQPSGHCPLLLRTFLPAVCQPSNA